MQCWMYAATATKKSLALCKLYAHLPPPRKLYRYGRRTGEHRLLMFFNLGKGRDKKEHILQTVIFFYCTSLIIFCNFFTFLLLFAFFSIN